MEDKILEILVKTKSGSINIQDAKEKILNIFNEQNVCKCKSESHNEAYKSVIIRKFNREM